MVNAGVGDDQQAGLLEGASDLVGEGTGSEAPGNGVGASVGGELEDGTLCDINVELANIESDRGQAYAGCVWAATNIL